MGAFIGALHAKGVSTPQMRTLAESFNSKFELWKLADPVIPPVACFFKGEKVKEMLRDQIDDAAFRDLEIPLSIIALNLETHEKLVISHGNVADAVHASCAIPGVVCPVEWEGHRCLDGGIVDPVPVQPIRDQVDVVIAVTLSPSEEELAAGMMKREKDAPKDFSKRIFKSVQRNTSVYAEGNVVDTLRRSLKSAQTQIANASCELADIIISPKIFDLSWHSFESMERIIDAGRQAALNQMPIIQQKIAEISKIKGVKDPSKVKTIT